MIVVYKVTLLDLVVRHLDAAAQFRQHHHQDILILQPNDLIVLIHLLVTYRLDDRIGIDHATGALIDTLLQKHRALLRLSHLISRDCH